MFRSPLADGVVVIVVLLLFFGPKRLPMLSRSIGESIKEFKGGIQEATASDEEKDKNKAELTSSGATAAAAARETADTGSERPS